MSGYGPPQVPPRAPASPEQRAAILNYVAGGLGVLAFVWGFLDWLSNDAGDGGSGYETFGVAAAAVGLSIAAGLMAVAGVLDKRPLGLAPAAVAIAAVLVTFGLLVNHADGVSAGIGMILNLITTILQAAALVAAWLLAVGKIAMPSAGSQHQWQPPPSQYGPPPQGPPPNQPQDYGPPQSGSYGPPQQQGYGAPQGPPPGYGPPPQSGPPQSGPPQSGPPQSGPPQGSSQQSGSTQSLPSQNPPQSPPQDYGRPQDYGQQGPDH